MAAPLYESTTRRTTLSEASAPLREAIARQAESASLVLTDVHVWCTHRVNRPATSFFGKLLGRRANGMDPDAEHDMVLVIHPTHLLVGTHGAARGASVLSVPLLGATVKRGAVTSAFAAGMDVPSDDGIAITGFPGTEGRPGSYFFGIGGAEADACFEAVQAAVVRAKNPR